jgi:fluoroacetyl-CoA thioesterase
MRDTVKPGLEKRVEQEVLPSMSPPHLPVKVLSTPAMVGLVEGVCMGLLAEHLDEGETSVGTHVCMSHDAAVGAGSVVSVWCRVSGLDRRRVDFEIGVDGPDGQQVSRGTHQRAVISTSRFG